jgi:hypothetical protein
MPRVVYLKITLTEPVHVKSLLPLNLSFTVLF